MSTYTIFMLITVPALAIGWLAYWLWMRKIAEEEKNQPKQVSKRLTQSKSEVSDWAQKMAQFKPPKRKFPSEDEKSEESGQDNP
ncbi:MAG: hypothetical protein CEE38_10795 [Planctomycetes bacterium B3_Pla]|nr:MAG: hypothetical protein CEE38_10795 [Planctomycetes bacterium B3_Pla]